MWNYRNPVSIKFGVGSFNSLPQLLDGRSYALVTYGEPFFRELGDRLARTKPPLLTIDDISPNPDVALLGTQTARFQTLSRMPEAIVALGGGSVIDSAKVFAAANGDFSGVLKYLKTEAGAERLAPIPVIAVPTTAGTGSEVTCWATVWDAAADVKYSLAHPGLYPRHAVVDPELMLGKPRDLTISTGLDALSHALESLWNRNANPVSAASAVAAAKDLLDTLPRVASDLGNLDLRVRMARAALLAGMAFSNTKTAIAHSLSYPITLRHGVTHGIACSFTLPMVMRSVAEMDGLCREGITAIFAADPRAGADRLAGFLQRLGVSTEFSAYGITPDEWGGLIDSALTGERGQNFIGSRDRLISAAGLAAPPERRVATS